MTKYLIVQASPISTGSTLLMNLICGLIRPDDPVYYASNMMQFIRRHHEDVLDERILIIKTHNMGWEHWQKRAKEDNRKLFFICSQRDETISPPDGSLLIDYNEILETDDNTLESIISNFYKKMQELFSGEDISLDEEACVKRVNEMNIMVDKIKDKPFSHLNRFYHVHGSHRSKINKE